MITIEQLQESLRNKIERYEKEYAPVRSSIEPVYENMQVGLFLHNLRSIEGLVMHPTAYIITIKTNAEDLVRILMGERCPYMDENNVVDKDCTKFWDWWRYRPTTGLWWYNDDPNHSVVKENEDE